MADGHGFARAVGRGAAAVGAGASRLGRSVRGLGFADRHLTEDGELEHELGQITEGLRAKPAALKVDALKRLIALISVGRDVSFFFPQVVINVMSDSFEVKVLVYIFLVRYAEQKPDESLLSINSFQKDLGHPSPRVRALALRVLSSLRVHVVLPVIMLSVRKCAADQSAYVRKACAHAVPKIFRLDRGTLDELVEVIQQLLQDTSPFVLSSAIAAFEEVCPNRLDLLHRHYRKLCVLLVDMDEWGQTLLLNLLLRYARTQFLPADEHPRTLEGALASAEAASKEPEAAGGVDDAEDGATPAAADGAAVGSAAVETPAAQATAPRSVVVDSSEGFYSDDDEGKAAGGGLQRRSEVAEGEASESEDEDDAANGGPSGEGSAEEGTGAPADGRDGPAPETAPTGLATLDEDHRLLLRCSRPLLQSRNAGVVMATVALQHFLAPVSELPRIARAVMFAIRACPESQHVLLENVNVMAAMHPATFRPFFTRFFVHPRDVLAVKAIKLEILTRLITDETADLVLAEMQSYLRDPSKEFVELTVRTIGQCAVRVPRILPGCVRSLLALSSHPAEAVASNAVVVINAIIQQDPKAHVETAIQLLRHLQHMRVPVARASVVWLAAWDFGELSTSAADGAEADEATAKLMRMAPEALRRVAASFASEDSLVKLHLVNSLAKLHLRGVEGAGKLYAYVVELASLDASYDVRDRVRFVKALLPPPQAEGAPSEEATALQAHAEAVLLCDKPGAPLPSPCPPSGAFRLGTLSHIVQHAAPGYAPLPPHPEVAPPGDVRAVPVDLRPERAKAPGQAPARGPVAQEDEDDFYSGSESEQGSYTDGSSYTSESYSESGSESYSDKEEPSKPA